MNLCEEFRHLAFDTWRRISLAKSVRYHLKEESVTDDIILTLKVNQRKRVFTQEFNKIQEGRLGADWAFWLVEKGNAAQFRIQAKIINHGSDTFEHLHYSKNGVYQSDLLITSSKAANAIPLYCLYSYWDTASFPIRDWCCGTFPSAPESYGCALLSALDVQRIRPQRNLPSLVDKMRPWHCLICCSGFGGDTLPERAVHTYTQLFDQNVAPSNYLRHPPEYVLKMLDGQVLETPPDENVTRVIIIKGDVD